MPNDYREELLNKSLYMLNEAGIKDLDTVKTILIRAIGDYEIAERCTEIATLDGNNEQIIKMFLATKKIEGGSTRTSKVRWYVIRKFNMDLNKPFTQISTFDILKWLADEQKRVSLSTAESYRTILSSLFTWMYVNGVIPNNPMETIKPIKHPNHIKNSFTPVEIDALKSVCKTDLDRAMIELLLSSGLRCEELCNLKWNDIDFVTKDITVIEGKGNKDRVTMMDDVTRKYLIDYRANLNYESEYVFPVKYRGVVKVRDTGSVWKKLKILGERANVPEVNPHKFRHTFATTLYKRGLDVRMIQKLLGHSNINTTMIYIESDMDMLRDAYKKCT